MIFWLRFQACLILYFDVYGFMEDEDGREEGGSGVVWGMVVVAGFCLNLSFDVSGFNFLFLVV